MTGKGDVVVKKKIRGKKLLLWAAIAAMAAAGIFFWKSGGRVDRKCRMIFIPKVIDEDNDFWKLLIEGAEMAASEYQIELYGNDALCKKSERGRHPSDISGF